MARLEELLASPRLEGSSPNVRPHPLLAGIPPARRANRCSTPERIITPPPARIKTERRQFGIPLPAVSREWSLSDLGDGKCREKALHSWPALCRLARSIQVRMQPCPLEAGH